MIHFMQTHNIDENRSFFELAAILCTWVILKQSYALCSDFLHLKQSSFLNNSFWIKLSFDLLSFFHEETDDVSQVVDMLMTERAAWVADTLTTDQTFNSINLTSTCMQMLTNSFKFVIHSLSVAHWKSELILCWRSSSRVSLLYSSSVLNLWNFIQNSWNEILFWYSFKYCRWVVWWWLRSSYILFMIDSTSLTFKNRFRDVSFIQSAICLIAASLTQLLMYAIFNSFNRKMILVYLQLVSHSKQSIVYILRRIFEQRWVE